TRPGANHNEDAGEHLRAGRVRVWKFISTAGAARAGCFFWRRRPGRSPPARSSRGCRWSAFSTLHLPTLSDTLRRPHLRSALDKRGGAPRALQHVTKRSMVLGRLPLYGEPEVLPDRSQASSLSAEELVVRSEEHTSELQSLAYLVC